MPKPLKAFLAAFVILPLSAASVSAVPRFEFMDGDRVVFLGDSSKLQLAEPATLKLTFTESFNPSQPFINGKPADTGTADLPAGIHTIAFRTENPKQAIRPQSNTGTFLPEW